MPDFHFTVNSNSDDPTFSVWTAGDTMSLVISPGDDNGLSDPFKFPFGPNSVEDGNWLSFSSLPTVSVSGGPASGGTPPIVSCSIKAFGADSVATQVSVRDMLECVFVNSSVDDALTPYTIDVSGIKITTGPDVQNARMHGWAQYGAGGIAVRHGRCSSVRVAVRGGRCWVSREPGGQVPGPYVSETRVIDAYATANNPPVSVLPGAVGASVSPVLIIELHEGVIGEDYLCIESGASGDWSWNNGASPTATAVSTPAGGATHLDPTIDFVGAAAGPAFNGSDATFVLIGIDAESSAPTTITISGLLVNAGSSIGAQQARAFLSSDPDCTGGIEVDLPGDQNYTHDYFTVFSVGNTTINTRIAGSNLEQTAVAALEAAFPSTEPGDGCLDANASPDPGEDDPGSSVVLATTATWQDALAASYLASFLDTGVLLTPPDHLSKYTENAIRNEGVTSVYIVGGNLAVSKAVADQLKDTPQYHCGGANLRQGDLGGNLLVHRIWGATDLDTAMEVATFVNSGFVNFHSGGFDLSGAALPVGSPIPNMYARGGGTDTSGSLATIRVRTAILATNNTWQDAAAAGSLSYYEQMPVILTARGALSAQARTALLDLGIQQVVLLGGPIAISDQVVSDLSAIGVKSLRISGVDHTDTAVQLATFEVNGNSGLNGHDAGLDWNADTCEPSGTKLPRTSSRAA